MKYQWALRKGTLLIAATAMLLVPASFATAGEKNWKVRLMGAFAGENNGIVTSGGYSGAGVSISGGVGAGVNFDYRYRPSMSFEMGAMAIGADVRVGVLKTWPHHDVGVEVGGYVPLTFGFNYHPLKKNEGFDLYFGPLMASVIHSWVATGTIVDIGTQTNFGLGATLGADINFGKSRWSLNAAFKYISILTDSGDYDSRADFDPLIFTFGVGFRF